jgi:C1A family cysteine protease
MKKFVILFVIPMMLFAQSEISERIEAANEFLHDINATWTAGETSISSMSTIEFQNTLGLILGDETGREAFENVEMEMPTRGDLPSYINWKEKGCVTPVKNQRKCGSCYAFASCGLMESYYLRTEKLELDLSEQAFMMSTKVANLFGGCKGNNLWVCNGACALKGAPIEAECPYVAEEKECGNVTKKYKVVCLPTGTVAGIKNALVKHGPVVAGFMVYEDFKDYKGGVYHYSYGNLLGGHAILIVGYNDAGKYWIVKNSWGSDWGESCDGKGGEGGYFRIGYGECGIESIPMGPFSAAK